MTRDAELAAGAARVRAEYPVTPLTDAERALAREQLGEAVAALRAGLGPALDRQVASVPHTPPVHWPVSEVAGPGVLVLCLADAETSAEVVDQIKDQLGERLGVDIVVVAGASGVAFVPSTTDSPE